MRALDCGRTLSNSCDQNRYTNDAPTIESTSWRDVYLRQRVELAREQLCTHVGLVGAADRIVALLQRVVELRLGVGGAAVRIVGTSHRNIELRLGLVDAAVRIVALPHGVGERRAQQLGPIGVLLVLLRRERLSSNSIRETV